MGIFLTVQFSIAHLSNHMARPVSKNSNTVALFFVQFFHYSKKNSMQFRPESNLFLLSSFGDFMSQL